MPSVDSTRLLRWSRWGVVLAALVAAGVLVLPAWFGYAGTLDASQIVARGQGQAIEEGIIGHLRALRGRPSEADLAEILEALSPSGLRYLELSGPESHRVGTSRIEPGPARKGPAEGRRFIHAHGRVRLQVMLPGPPRPPPRRDEPLGEGPPGRRGLGALGSPHGHPAPPPGMGPPRPRPLLFIEYDPGPANGLVSRAQTSLVINSIAALGLVIASWFAFFWLRKQEHSEAVRARERHLASLGEMSAVLAHEIRNPLTSLKGHAQLLAESLGGSAEKEAKAERVVREAVRLETLTSDLLDFVRTGELKRSRCSPGEILRQACAEVDTTKVWVDVGAAPAECELDNDRMQQALTNLLRNAIQASSEPVEACAMEASGNVVFEVRDRGPGIPQEELEDIFEPFRTTKLRGTGLGLAVVRRVVELHGGTVVASNRAGGGARFRIEIPMVA